VTTQATPRPPQQTNRNHDHIFTDFDAAHHRYNRKMRVNSRSRNKKAKLQKRRTQPRPRSHTPRQPNPNSRCRLRHSSTQLRKPVPRNTHRLHRILQSIPTKNNGQERGGVESDPNLKSTQHAWLIFSMSLTKEFTHLA
jgi:hypothetical protein